MKVGKDIMRMHQLIRRSTFGSLTMFDEGSTSENLILYHKKVSDSQQKSCRQIVFTYLDHNTYKENPNLPPAATHWHRLCRQTAVQSEYSLDLANKLHMISVSVFYYRKHYICLKKP